MRQGLDYWRNSKKNLVLSEDCLGLYFHDYNGNTYAISLEDMYSLISTLETFQ